MSENTLCGCGLVGCYFRQAAIIYWERECKR